MEPVPLPDVSDDVPVEVWEPVCDWFWLVSVESLDPLDVPVSCPESVDGVDPLDDWPEFVDVSVLLESLVSDLADEPESVLDEPVPLVKESVFLPVSFPLFLVGVLVVSVSVVPD